MYQVRPQALGSRQYASIFKSTRDVLTFTADGRAPPPGTGTAGRAGTRRRGTRGTAARTAPEASCWGWRRGASPPRGRAPRWWLRHRPIAVARRRRVTIVACQARSENVQVLSKANFENCSPFLPCNAPLRFLKSSSRLLS